MVLVSLLAVLPLSTPACDRIELNAEIGSGLREIRGTISCHQPISGAAVAVYPRSIASTAGLDDINQAWFYPGGFDDTGMSLAANGVSIEDDKVWSLLGPTPLPEAVTIHFFTRVPRRNGTFGVSGVVGYLLGGWHPAFGDGERLAAASIHYRIKLPPGVAGLVGANPVGLESPRIVTGEHFGKFVPLVLAPRLRVRAFDRVVVMTPEPRYSELRDVTAHRDDTALDDLVDTIKVGEAFADAAGLPVERPLFVVLTPLRESLVEPFDGGLAVSDRAFHVFAWERFLKLHRMSVWREQLGLRAQPACVRKPGGLAPELCADLVGAALRDRLGADLYGGKEYAPDLLEAFAVIPEIDSLIFAPQIPFVTTYFEAIDESLRVRRRLDDFDHNNPRGKLLYEKLTDRFGSEAVTAGVRHFLFGLGSVWHAICADSCDSVLRPWLSSYPRLNYALEITCESDDEVKISVAATGPDASAVEEPITVELEDCNNVTHRATRLGPGELKLHGAGPPEVVTLDPEGRLVELAHPDGRGARFDNREPHRWRFLLANIASVIAVTGRELTFAPVFSLRRIHDLTWSSILFVEYGAANIQKRSSFAAPRTLGAGASLLYKFGRELNPLDLAQTLALSAAFERLKSDNSDDVLPGNDLSFGLSYRYDDRLSPYWSYEGKGLVAGVTGHVQRDEQGRTHVFARAGAGGFYIQPLAFGHALLGRLRIDANLGDSLPQNELRLGDAPRSSRGFERTEAQGKRRVLLSGEYRHLFVGDAKTDFWGAATWSRFEGALFADAIYLPVSRQTLEVIDGALVASSCQQTMFYDIGYGVRFIADVLGVSPAELALDFGVPLNRCPDERNRLPFTMYVSFVQSFGSF